jgi:hypothetical protein
MVRFCRWHNLGFMPDVALLLCLGLADFLNRELQYGC